MVILDSFHSREASDERDVSQPVRSMTERLPVESSIHTKTVPRNTEDPLSGGTNKMTDKHYFVVGSFNTDVIGGPVAFKKGRKCLHKAQMDQCHQASARLVRPPKRSHQPRHSDQQLRC